MEINVICTLTQSVRERKQQPWPPVNNDTKNVRRLFILHQIMYCLDSTCSGPFHSLLADFIDSYSGSSELITAFNRLGVCVSIDTLQRDIQGVVQHLRSKGLLQEACDFVLHGQLRFFEELCSDIQWQPTA